MPAESVKALAETGFFRLLQPASVRRPGGRPGHLPDRGPADRQRLRVDRLGRLGPRRAPLAARPVPAAGPAGGVGRRPGTRMSSSYAPTGRAQAVDGGHLLTGRWSFSSGCDHASWVLLGGIVDRRRGQARRLPHVPAAGQRLRHRRRVGHGRAARHRQQRHRGGRRVRARAPLAQLHRRARCVCPGQQVNPAPLYRLPFGSIFSYAITTPIIGMAMGAYDAHVAYQQRAGARLLRRARRRPRTRTAQVRVAEAAA